MIDQTIELRNRHDLAVIDEDARWTWHDLEGRIAVCSSDIAAAGGAGACVAVLGSHGAGNYADVLAALGVAGRIVFIDPEIQTDALEPIVKALDIRCVVSVPCAARMKTFQDLLPETVFIRSTDTRADHNRHSVRQEDGPVKLRLGCAEYVVLTSGTTGTPKAILQTTTALRRHIANYTGYLTVSRGEKVLQLASSAWDAGLMDVFTALYCDAVLCTMNPRQSTMEEVAKFIGQHEIDILHMTVPYFRQFYRAGLGNYARPKRIVIGGEKMFEGDLDLFNSSFAAGSRLYNAYGPTECTTAMYACYEQGAAKSSGIWSLAHQVEGVSTDLRDADGRKILGAGPEGEVTLTSDLVASVLDLPSRRFVRLGREAAGSVRCFATGDIAHYDENEHVAIVGRRDSVIKVNGLKVSLVEVEAALRSLTHVRDCCVFTINSGDGEEIAAAVIPADASLTEPALQKMLADRLDGHKRPRQYLLMERLPLTRNNKFDRDELKRLVLGKQAASRFQEREQPPLLVAMMKALKKNVIDVNQSFFDNGGDSLMALSLVAAMKRKGIKVSLEELISDKPVADYLAFQGGETALPTDAEPTGAPTSLPGLPNRYFLEDRGIPDLDIWCQSCVLDYAGPERRLEEIAQVLSALLTRHLPDMTSVDVQRWPAGMSVEQALAECESRISLAAGRMVAAAALMSDGRLSVVVSCHQFVVDRVSWIVLLSDLSEAVEKGQMDAWTKPEAGYRDWIQSYSRDLSTERASEFWDSLPWSSCPDPEGARRSIPRREAFELSEIHLGQPAGNSASLHADIGDWLLAAVLRGFSEVFPGSSQKIDFLSHGRGLIAGGLATDGLFGWFTVIYPVVLETAELDINETVQAVQAYRRSTDGIAHTFGNTYFLPEGGGTQKGERQCFASFNFLGDIAIASSDCFSVNPISLTSMHGRPSHHLECTGYQQDGALLLKIEFNPEVFNRALVERLCKTIAEELRRAGVIGEERAER